MNSKTGYLTILLTALAGIAVIPSALGAMHEQTSTQSLDNVTTATNDTTIADDMTDTAGVNETTTANATGAGNETTTAGANETTIAGNVTVTITPFAQSPGGSVLVQADGLEPETNTTIAVDNELVGTTQSDENGTLFYALGVPSKPITTMTITVDETGEETIENDTHAWDGTVRVVVEDEAGNRGFGELTVLAPVSGESNQTAVAGLEITKETIDRFIE
jgi:hypothetical protein